MGRVAAGQTVGLRSRPQARCTPQGRQSSRGQATKAKAAKAKDKDNAKADAKTEPQSEAVEEPAASACASAGVVPSIMDLLDQQDDKAAVDVMRLALQSDSDDMSAIEPGRLRCSSKAVRSV